MYPSFVPFAVVFHPPLLDKDAAAVREQLEKDLEAAKAQLMARRASETTEPGEQEETKVGGKKSSTEIEVGSLSINICILVRPYSICYNIIYDMQF